MKLIHSKDSPSRAVAGMADASLKAEVVAFAEYAGNDGVSGTSKGGFMIQINRKIKLAFGVAADQAENPLLLQEIASLRLRIAYILIAGKKRNFSREDIRRIVYEEIDTAGANWRRIENLFMEREAI